MFANHREVLSILRMYYNAAYYCIEMHKESTGVFNFHVVAATPHTRWHGIAALLRRSQALNMIRIKDQHATLDIRTDRLIFSAAVEDSAPETITNVTELVQRLGECFPLPERSQSTSSTSYDGTCVIQITRGRGCNIRSISLSVEEVLRDNHLTGSVFVSEVRRKLPHVRHDRVTLRVTVAVHDDGVTLVRTVPAPEKESGQQPNARNAAPKIKDETRSQWRGFPQVA